MIYDIHGTWENYVGLHAALYSGGGDPEATANANASVNFILKYGVDSSKIIFGIPTYAKVRQLSTSSTSVGSPATKTFEPELPYRDVCKQVKSGQISEIFSNAQQSVYAVDNTQTWKWMSYDNLESVSVKAKYINSYNLGGAMFW